MPCGDVCTASQHLENQMQITLTIPGRLPSLNALLAMQHWSRHKFKAELATVFLSALRASENDSWMRTTLFPNITQTFADTLDSYLRTRLESAKLKQANAKPGKAKRNARR